MTLKNNVFDYYVISFGLRNVSNKFLALKEAYRILKPGGVITAQVGCLSKNPKQVDNWTKVLSKNFGNTKLDEIFIPSFDCRWAFASSIMDS